MSADKPKTEVDYGEPSDQLVYVDGASGIALHNGVVRFNFYQTLYDSNPSNGESRTYNVVACRVAVPIEAFKRIGDWITTNFDKMVADGVIELQPVSLDSDEQPDGSTD